MDVGVSVGVGVNMGASVSFSVNVGVSLRVSVSVCDSVSVGVSSYGVIIAHSLSENIIVTSSHITMMTPPK